MKDIGGYLYASERIDERLEFDKSTEFAMQLLERKDKSATDYYALYHKAENSLINQPIKLMSKLTRAILKSIDYEKVKYKRKCNFEYLHSKLQDRNILKFDSSCLDGVMVYLFVNINIKLKSNLIANNIYVASYWTEVMSRKGRCNVEKLVDQLMPLPIDQRYGREDMDRVLMILAEE